MSNGNDFYNYPGSPNIYNDSNSFAIPYQVLTPNSPRQRSALSPLGLISPTGSQSVPSFLRQTSSPRRASSPGRVNSPRRASSPERASSPRRASSPTRSFQDEQVLLHK